jgi:hypothetical protein
VRSHDAPDGYNALIGGVVVRDPGLPALAGRYLYGALSWGQLRAARIVDGRVLDDVDTGLVKPVMTSFGTDNCGRVYLTSLDGGLYRLSQGQGGCDAVGVTLTVRAGQRPQRPGAASGTVRATITCAVACRARAELSLRNGAAVLGHGAQRTLALGAGRSQTVALRVRAAVLRAVRRAQTRGRRVTARVVVVARAADGTAQRRSSVDAALRR